MSFPAMSHAVPGMGSKKAKLSPIPAEGEMPTPPMLLMTTADRMSPRAIYPDTGRNPDSRRDQELNTYGFLFGFHLD